MPLTHRLLTKDPALWQCPDGTPLDEAVGQLGWLDAVPWMQDHIAPLQQWADGVVRQRRFAQVVVLGMGGASLAAEVFYRVFGVVPGYPPLVMLDSTHPEEIGRRVRQPETTLFVVASKSGATVETLDLMAWFYARVNQQVDDPGPHFVAITDPDSPLVAQARDLGFARIFINPANIPGRYSALSYFGLVPAALMGVNLTKLLVATRRFVEQTRRLTGPGVEIEALARLMARADDSGRHNLHIHIDAPFHYMELWIEQLVAESLGKSGHGVVPVFRRRRAEDRTLISSPGPQATVMVTRPGLENSQNGRVMWTLAQRDNIGAEFLRWEMATALAADMIGINPFDQPDVEQTKARTRAFIGGQPLKLPLMRDEGDYLVAVPADKRQQAEDKLIRAQSADRCPLIAFLQQAATGQYLALLAYLPYDHNTAQALETLDAALGRRMGIDITQGFGPRYLHSTGQLHKGGPATGSFMQIIEEGMAQLPVPNKVYGFAELHRAQADGDFSVLAEMGRPIMRVTLKKDRLKSLAALAQRVSQ